VSISLLYHARTILFIITFIFGVLIAVVLLLKEKKKAIQHFLRKKINQALSRLAELVESDKIQLRTFSFSPLPS